MIILNKVLWKIQFFTYTPNFCGISTPYIIPKNRTVLIGRHFFKSLAIHTAGLVQDFRHNDRLLPSQILAGHI